MFLVMPHWSESIYLSHRQNLYGYALSIVRCNATAEDAVHNVFTRLLDTPEPKNGNPVAYVFRCIRNSCIDLMRSKKPIPSTDNIELFSQADDSDPTVLIEQDETRQALQHMLMQINEAQREVIVMRLFANLTFQQIADALDCPLGTVTSRYRRGLDDLKQLMENNHDTL